MSTRFDMLHRLIDRAESLNETRAWFFVIDKSVADEIIRLNTEEQLEEQGIDSQENSLGEYALRTIAEKIEKGDRHDHVTLKDTGAFYDSFIVEVDRKGFNIVADDVAFYDRPLTDVYGIDIVGLTVDNIESLSDWIIPKLRLYTKDELLR